MPDVRAGLHLGSHQHLIGILTGRSLLSVALAVLSVITCGRRDVDMMRRLRVRTAGRSKRIDRQRHDLAHTGAMLLVGGPAETHGHALLLTSLGWAKDELVAAAASIDVASAFAQEGSEGAMPASWPVFGRVTSPFGWRVSPYGLRREYHPGLDIAAPCGTPVRATDDGEVIFAGRHAGYGTMVVVEHGDGVETRYAHLSAVYVEDGERVCRGQPVGELGRSGRATGPHLHYEVRIADQPVDPECFLPDEGDWGVAHVTRAVGNCPVGVFPSADRNSSMASPAPRRSPGWLGGAGG